MAGMFYSLQETAKRLGKTEDEVKQLATDGKLREFRDGSNLLFKIEEVNTLTSDALDMVPDVEPEAVPADIDELLELEPVVEEPTEAPAEEAPMLDLDTELPMEVAPAEEEPMLDLDTELPTEVAPAEEEVPDLDLAAAADTSSEMGLTPDMEDSGEASVELSEDDIMADMGEPEPVAELDAEESEISLAPELGDESDITNMDTALAGEGINVLGETDGDYDVTDDSLAETVGPAGTSTEASLEEIEDDVNLDSFGSGSGLLDLSLQADDTSLGGILDEIYTADDGEGAPGEGDIADDLTTETDSVVPDDEMAAPEPMIAAPIMAGAYVDAAPDSQSNMLGMLLFLPLLALLYTAIVTASAQKGVMPSILESVQGMIWYIMGGAIVVSLIVAGASFVVGAEKKPKARKAKKAKKEKGPKAKKEKKAKAPKPKKEKKSLLGKKKK